MKTATQYFWTMIVLGAGLLCMTERTFIEGNTHLAHCVTASSSASSR